MADVIKFLEEFYGVKNLTLWQKLYLRTMFKSKDIFEVTFPCRSGRTLIYKTQIELAKAMEMDFVVASPGYIEVYKKGKLVERIKNGNNK